MSKVGYFNTLPPKPEYLRKVRNALTTESPLSLHKIVKATGLTKTQVACTLEQMVADGEIIETGSSPKMYSWKDDPSD